MPWSQYWDRQPRCKSWEKGWHKDSWSPWGQEGKSWPNGSCQDADRSWGAWPADGHDRQQKRAGLPWKSWQKGESWEAWPADGRAAHERQQQRAGSHEESWNSRQKRESWGVWPTQNCEAHDIQAQQPPGRLQRSRMFEAALSSVGQQQKPARAHQAAVASASQCAKAEAVEAVETAASKKQDDTKVARCWDPCPRREDVTVGDCYGRFPPMQIAFTIGSVSWTVPEGFFKGKDLDWACQGAKANPCVEAIYLGYERPVKGFRLRAETGEERLFASPDDCWKLLLLKKAAGMRESERCIIQMQIVEDEEEIMQALARSSIQADPYSIDVMEEDGTRIRWKA
mmetsp:Transcript_12572/g.23631  ORF Transcript_12572/g.23631 Transcript_12572/m.23631 type:complete len:341 (-) Transcript_12572:239-1261(-)